MSNIPKSIQETGENIYNKYWDYIKNAIYSSDGEEAEEIIKEIEKEYEELMNLLILEVEVLAEKLGFDSNNPAVVKLIDSLYQSKIK